MREVAGQNQLSKNRMKLWLRAERAFGLTAVPVTINRNDSVEQLQQSQDAKTPLTTSSVAAARVEPQAMAASEPMLIPPPSVPNFDAPVLDREQKIIRLQQLDQNEVAGCTRCRLGETRTYTVFGEGDADAKIFFIGEGPGETEDQTGRPFVGRAGQLLDKMIGGMGLKREQVFIANIVKCRPPNNRVPALDEVATCTPYLERQIEIVRPRVIVTLGRPAATYMLNSKLSMGRLRGEWQTWRGIKLMPTFHPSYVLRSYTEEVRAAVWSDLKKVLIELGMPIPSKASVGT